MGRPAKSKEQKLKEYKQRVLSKVENIDSSTGKL